MRVKMNRFDSPVRHHMQSPVVSVRVGDDLARVRDELDKRRFSSLPVVDEEGRPVGVLSRTDLLRLGRMEAGRRPKSALLTLPQRPVERAMTRPIVVVGRDATVRDCARLMREHHHHRVFVIYEERLAGVFTTRDLMTVVSQARVEGTVADLMTAPVFTVRVEEPIALATDRLARAHVSGLVVVDDGWPVGIFTQAEALEAARMPRDTPVEDVFSPALLCLSQRAPLHRAAAQAAATSARRVIATHEREMVGILTGLDFTRVAC
jgi:CBS domain-containing protein